MSEKTKKCRKCGRELPKKRGGGYESCSYCEIDVLWKTEEWKSFDKLLRKVDVRPVLTPMTTLKKSPFLKTNTCLDELFAGGIRRGQLVEVWGEYASGKTEFCLSCVAESTGKVIYVDSEHTFVPDRLVEIAKARGKTEEEIKNLDKRILYYEPENWKEQMAVFHQLPKIKEGELDLIIVDSLMAYFREEEDFLGRQNLFTRQGLVRIHLAKIRRIARKLGAVAIVTNQAVSNPNVTQFTRSYERKSGAGGDTVRHIPEVILSFRKAKDPKRIARIMDSLELPNLERAFILSEKGVDDIPKEEAKVTPEEPEIEEEKEE